jgi:PBSX family phage portal protein
MRNISAVDGTMNDNEEFVDIASPKPMEVQKFFDPLEQGPSFFKSFNGLSPYTKRKISKAASAQSQNAEDAYYAKNGYGLFDLATPPYNFEELVSFYDISSTNHSAIDAKVKNVVGLGYNFDLSELATTKIQAIESDTRTEKVQRKFDKLKSQLILWLNGLNDSDDFEETLDRVAKDFEIIGNGYLEVGRTVTGEVGYLGHIPASTVRIRRKRDGFVQVVGNSVTFFRNFGAQNPSPITGDPRPNELIHLKKYSPTSTFYGVPDSVSAATAIVGDSLASQYNVKFFDNSATPRYIATLTGGRLSATAEDKLFKFLQSSLRGNPHRTLFMPLPQDPMGNPIEFKLHRVDDALLDGAWENYRERNKLDILIAHGVPESRVGGGSGSNIASALSSDRMFKEQVVVPTQRIFESAINKIIKEKTDAVTFNLNELTLTDELSKSQIYERLIRNQIVTPNEVRNELGMPARSGGDDIVEPKPQIKAEQNAQANGSRERDKTRVDNNSDSTSTVSGRNPKGEGSKE